MLKFVRYWFLALVLIVILGTHFVPTIFAQSAQSLSLCLKDKGFIEYGTLDCPNCELQKSYFGPSFSNIPSVRCDVNPQLCQTKQIRGYPTWEDAKGNLYRGAIPLPVLSQLSGCTDTPQTVQTDQNPFRAWTGNTIFSPLFLAFIAGLLSFFAPCCLPLFPAYFSVITGFTFAQLYGLEFKKIRGRVLISGLCFIAGFVVVYTAMGVVSSLVGKLLEIYLPLLLRVSGIFLIILGFVQLGVVKINALEFDYAWNVQKRLSHLGYITALVTGVAAALSWIPCIGPLLSPILLMAAKSDTVVQGTLLLFIYALGLSTPFFLGSLFFPSIVNALRDKRLLFHRVSQLAGLFLLAFGCILLVGKYQEFLDWMKFNINGNALTFWNYVKGKINEAKP